MNKIISKERVFTIGLSVLLSFVLFAAYSWTSTRNEAVSYRSDDLPPNYTMVNNLLGSSADNAMVDFTKASLVAIPAVVHIKTTFPSRTIKAQQPQQRKPFGHNDPFFDDFFDGFFGFGPQVIPEQQASGSGVLTSEDGYIVTNNHVITDEQGNVAKQIDVTLSNGQEYKAELIGNDPSSDLAVIKVNGKKMPYLLYGNSDNVSIGQWVLAVGYPLNLDATVTAGIVSAKSRTLGINNARPSGAGGNPVSSIESFIQTDAAVNKGNSGGALVNLMGEFVGVNSAIATPTGYYSGYSFAIPSNIVKKIAGDIIKYGKTQRGFLGIEFPNSEVPKEQLERQGMYVEKGVYVSGVPEGGAAAKAGVKKSDVIIKLDDKEVQNGAALSARLAMYKPGDKVKLTLLRDKKELTLYAVLENNLGTYEVSKKVSIKEEVNAEFVPLSDSERDKYEIRKGGLKVVKINEKGLLKKTRMQEGFIIVSVSGNAVETEKELFEILEDNRGSTLKLEGFYPNSDGLYSYPIKIE